MTWDRCTGTDRLSSAAHGGENRTRKTPGGQERWKLGNYNKVYIHIFLIMGRFSDLLLECSHCHVGKDFDCYTRR